MSTTRTTPENARDMDDKSSDQFQLLPENFGLPLDQLYRLAITFYREKCKSGELIVPYTKRLLFMAYAKQVNYGPFNDSVADESGWFDIVGNDRTKTWKDLGDLSAFDSMSAFIALLDNICPSFRDFVTKQVQLPKNEKNCQESDQSTLVANDSVRFEAQRQQIQEALNRQTYHQFWAYAQQQFVGDLIQQEALIKQLQEQHYQQYMAQVYAQQAKLTGASPEGANDDVSPPSGSNQKRTEHVDDKNESDVSDEEPGDDLPSNPVIPPASMWNRQDILEFKVAIRKEGPEGIIKIGHGETVTVRVPTHEEGNCLFWEFATDNYDIGFGVFFEWTISESSQVSVHVTESSDEEIDEEFDQAELKGGEMADIESGNSSVKKTDSDKPHIDEVVPVFRRDSHEQVYAGSHEYPSQGVYLLKFDNSYSLWRSKTLYYRVYYSK